MSETKAKHFSPHLQRYLFTGVITIIPIWITWVLFTFILGQLSNVGRPWVWALSSALHPTAPALSEWLLAPWFESAVAVILTIVFLYFLGWAATKVIGKRAIEAFDGLMARIPFVTRIYGAVKNLMNTIQKKPERVQRVVLIPFPSAEMKTVAFVTRLLRDKSTGQELAAVYVPTTPNPTSGYLEIVPLEKVVSTDWTVDEAMTFIISGGAVAPEQINYSQGPELASSA